LGGIFFSLVRTQVSDDEAMRIDRAWRCFHWCQRQPKQPNAPTASAPPTFPPFVWEEAASIIAELTAHAGDATTVNVTVIGRPTHVVERQGVLILTFRSTNAPTLPATPTTSMIVMQQTQWNKVRDALHQPDDALIVEGYPVQSHALPGSRCMSRTSRRRHGKPPSARGRRRRCMRGREKVKSYNSKLLWSGEGWAKIGHRIADT
jgi:hypothetical protein